MKINKIEFIRVVARDRLIHQIDFEKIECSKSSIDVMYDELYEKKKSIAESVYSEYRYAGITSVNIFEAIEFPQELNNKQAFLAHTRKKLNIMPLKITGIEFRPTILEIPQINYIEDFGNGLLIQWVSGKNKPEWDGYEVVDRIVPKFEIMIIRFGSPLFVELRSGFGVCKQYLGLLQQLVSKDDENVLIEWLPLTHVSELEAEQIANKLSAGLLESEHVGEGCIGKFTLSAAPGIDDLKSEKQFTDMVAGRQYLAQVFHVDYSEVESGYSTKVKFRINMKGGFEFKSKVSERIISRILDVFVEVRYMKKASGM